jgi:hypothetical protein
MFRKHHILYDDGAPNLNVAILHLPPCEASFCNVRIRLPSRSGMDQDITRTITDGRTDEWSDDGRGGVRDLDA